MRFSRKMAFLRALDGRQRHHDGISAADGAPLGPLLAVVACVRRAFCLRDMA